MTNRNAIAKFIKESVEWLIKENQGCCRYKLDNRLAIFVGWSAGYGDEKRNDVIQDPDALDWGINVGLKVWTSDYMQTDYDYLNFPYEKEGDVWDMGLSIEPNDNYDHLADSMLKWYNEVKEYDMTDNGMILPREVEYDVVCFERTLKIKFSKDSNVDKEEILKALDRYYDEWQNDDDPTYCLEEYMVNEVCDEFNLSYDEWDSIPYGDEDYKPRETLWVCEHCLMGIECHEGNQARLAHGVDEMDAIESRCDWCHECGFDTLYELV